MTVTFVIPGIPVGKKRPRFARRGNFVKTYQPADDARRENLVALAYREAAGNLPPHDGPVIISLAAVFVPPQSWSKKRRADPGHKTTKPDLDNIAKSVLDGLNGVAFIDDARIVAINAGKRFGERNEIVVTIERIG